MLDFTSALYLGLRHPSGSLRPWSSFTTGVPAALASPPEAKQVAQEVATMQGCERGVLGSSTLHLFWDLFGMLSRSRVAIYVDAGTYPIARWGVERAAARGAPVHDFEHHDAGLLRRSVNNGRLRPVVLTDGFCPVCGKPAPLPEYLQIVRRFGGWLIVDDTQALGIFGYSPTPNMPYGKQGGGMLPHANITGPDVLAISSLAKGFGAPVAVLCGSRSAVQNFMERSDTRMHCSPPSLPVIHAAQHALAINREHGDRLRLRLAKLVSRFRGRAESTGLAFTPSQFPVQTISLTPDRATVDLHGQLLRRGIRTVLHRGHGTALCLSAVVSASHCLNEIDHAAGQFAELAQCALPPHRFAARSTRSWRSR